MPLENNRVTALKALELPQGKTLIMVSLVLDIRISRIHET